MKKVLVFLLACLSSTIMFAANPPLHYQIDQTGCQSMYTKINGVFTIDDVEVYNGEGMQDEGGGNLEIGVFDQNGVCRGAKFPTWRSKSNQWIYQLQIRGNDNFVYHFKVYDHATETELDLVDDFGEEITYQGNYTYQWNGSNSGVSNPYHLNFYQPVTLTKDIIGVGDENWNNENNGGYYLLASPLFHETNPTDVENMIDAEGNYDLYAFDQSQAGEEWQNQKEDASFVLQKGKGYLYANMNDVTLSFTGRAVSGNEITVGLDYTEGKPGWNLVGNPFTQPAYITDTAHIAMYFYVLNDNGNEVVSAQETTIAPMEGAFVCAEGEGESVKIGYTPSGKSSRASLALNLSQGRGVIDRAVVNFGKGNLPKFQINPNHTKVYIPVEGKDYAVVSSEGMGEMPVSFKAEKNGSYTLSFTSQEVSFNYLHLIDNMTGVDVNLLETPSYTFNATTSDYASRFRLVFATGSSVDGDSFSFVNAAGNLCIFGIEGEATVQVVDMLGHVLSGETFSGSYESKLDVAPGVYMIRLIQGNDMKVQKMVVR